MEAALNSVAYEFVVVNNDEGGCDRTQAEEAIAQQEPEVIPQVVISLQVEGAIAKRCCKQFARVKEALQQGWCNNPVGLFIKSCKEGLKPIKSLVDTTITKWYNWGYKNRIVIAMTGGHTAFTPDGVPVSLQQMMELYPMPQ